MHHQCIVHAKRALRVRTPTGGGVSALVDAALPAPLPRDAPALGGRPRPRPTAPLGGML